MTEPIDAKLARIDRASLWIFLGLSAACAVLTVLYLSIGDYVLAGTLGTQAIVWGGFTYIRKSWIRIGYNRGLWAAIMHAVEARERGLSGAEWIVSEMERATGVTTIHVPPDEQL